MAIQVTEAYRGRKTQEQLIPIGLYFRDDPALFGLADFLVETGRAIEIKGGPQLSETFGPETLTVSDGLPGAETIVDAPDDPLPFEVVDAVVDNDTAKLLDKLGRGKPKTRVSK